MGTFLSDNDLAVEKSFRILNTLLEQPMCKRNECLTAKILGSTAENWLQKILSEVESWKLDLERLLYYPQHLYSYQSVH